jgi:hypothetical protein
MHTTQAGLFHQIRTATHLGNCHHGRYNSNAQPSHRAKSGFALDKVVVDHAQRAKVHALRVVVVRKAKVKAAL